MFYFPLLELEEKEEAFLLSSLLRLSNTVSDTLWSLHWLTTAMLTVITLNIAAKKFV